MTPCNRIPMPRTPPFVAVGYDHGNFFVRTKAGLARFGVFTERNILALAPLEFWRDCFGWEKRGSRFWLLCLDSVYGLLEKAGPVDSYKLARGKP